MSDDTGCFTPKELANRYQVPVSLIRRLTDRLQLGVRYGAHSHRVIFAEDLPAIEIALKAMAKLYGSESVPTEMPVDGELCE